MLVNVKLYSRILLPSMLIALSILLVLYGELPDDSLLWRELQNTGHTVLFAIIAVSMLFVLRGSSATVSSSHLLAYSIAAFSSLVIGILLEAGQLLTDREPSISDITRDLAGILAGLGIFAVIDSELKLVWSNGWRRTRYAVAIASFSLLVISMVPIGYLVSAYVHRNEALPVIMDFQAGWAKPFLQLQQATLTKVTVPVALVSDTDHPDQQQVSKLILNPGIYPGISIIEPYPDWSAFTALTLNIYSAQPRPFDLVLRIHDSQHNQAYSDRFNQTLMVMPGKNRFRIPLMSVEHAPAGRDMDMKHIANVILFAVNVNDPIELYPGRLGLE